MRKRPYHTPEIDQDVWRPICRQTNARQPCIPDEITLKILEFVITEGGYTSLLHVIYANRHLREIGMEVLYKHIRVPARVGLLGRMIETLSKNERLAKNVESLHLEVLSRHASREAIMVTTPDVELMSTSQRAIAIKASQDSLGANPVFGRWTEDVALCNPLALSGLVLTMVPNLKHLCYRIFHGDRGEYRVETIPRMGQLFSWAEDRIDGPFEIFPVNIQSLRTFGVLPDMDMNMASLNSIEIDLTDLSIYRYGDFEPPNPWKHPGVRHVKVIMHLEMLVRTPTSVVSFSDDEYVWRYLGDCFATMDSLTSLHIHFVGHSKAPPTQATLDFGSLGYLLEYNTIEQLTVTIEGEVQVGTYSAINPFGLRLNSILSTPALNKISGPECVFISEGVDTWSPQWKEHTSASKLSPRIQELTITHVTEAGDRLAKGLYDAQARPEKVTLYHHKESYRVENSNAWNCLRALDVEVVENFEALM